MLKSSCFVVFVLLLLLARKGYSQTDGVIGYKGGLHLLQRDILLHLRINPAVTTYHDDGVTYNRYYQVVIQIGKEGQLGESLSVFSLMDTLKAPFIVAAVRATTGKWINHSGKEQTVVLPIYLLYKTAESGDSAVQPPVFGQAVYFGEQKQAAVYLQPVVVSSYPVVR
jgi:hypothetical protein